MTLREILTIIHDWAPPGVAQSYDNVGLQVGDENQVIERGLVALEITPAVITEAESIGADVIITHHPLLFRPIRTLSPRTLVGSMALRLARGGISVVAAHTNLDSVDDGVSAKLATMLGVNDPVILSPITDGVLKLVTFVPEAAVEQVRAAMSAAGAGRIGSYTDVAFKSEGIGLFRPLASANPHTGTSPGTLAHESEWRIEVAVTRDRLSLVRRALVDSHPYETPVYDVYEMMDSLTGFGLGMVGDLAEAQSLTEFLQHVCTTLGTRVVRYTGNPDTSVRRIAVCGGAGRDLIGDAYRNGADAFVTADIGYHSFFEVMNADGTVGMALIDAGHYETEAATEQLLVERLSSLAADVSWSRTKTRTSPIATFVAS